MRRIVIEIKIELSRRIFEFFFFFFCQRNKLLFFLFMFMSERMTSSRIDLKRQKSLNWTEERLSSKTTLFICILFSNTQTNTHTHTFTRLALLFWMREKKQFTKSIWDEEFELFVFQRLVTSFSISTRHLKNDHRKRSFFKH
jgi:hypothetical protein